MPSESRWQLASTQRGYWRHVSEGEGVTVFVTRDGTWKWVFEGEFSYAFSSPEAAMHDAEVELDLDPE